MVQRTARVGSMRAAAIVMVVGAGGASAAACGSVGADDLFVGDGSTVTGTGASSTVTTGSGGSSTGSTTTTTSSTTTGSTTTGSTTTGSTTTTTPLTCGNGKIDVGEDCDGADLGGLTCMDEGYTSPNGIVCVGCKLDVSGCKATCDGQKAEPGEVCDGNDLNGHDCTEKGFTNPAGMACTACQLDSSGCKPTCGNGVLEPGEPCDGASLMGANCTMFGFTNPAGLACKADCSGLNSEGCKPTCGNGVLEPNEVCDGNNLNGHSCTELGYVNPAGLKCSAGCALDASSCQAVCGNNKIEPGEQCDDGNTQNNDGCSSSCKTETPMGATCGSAIPINVPLGTQTIQGSTMGGGAHSGESCAGAAAPDRVYALTVQAAGFLTVSLPRAQTSYDSVLYISQNCADGGATTDLLCADSYDVSTGSALNGGEFVSIRVQAGQKYFVFVDGFANGDVGNYTLSIDLSAGNCNDPVPLPLEPGAPMSVLGSNTNIQPFTQGSCGGMPGGEVVYRITRPDTAQTDVATDSAILSFNAVLYARSMCFNGELACSNQGGGTTQESITFNMTANTPVFVMVDGSTGTSQGNYGLTITP